MVKQRTIRKTVKARGVGIHSGKVVNLTLIPAEADHGVVFKRLDAGGRQVHALSQASSMMLLMFSRENP